MEYIQITDAQKPLKLDLCCATRKPEGFFGIDAIKFPCVDLVYDLNFGIPLPDNCCEVVRAYDALEHMKDGLKTMKEIWRVCQDGALVDILVPSTDGRGAWQDLTHCCYSEDTEILTADGFKLFSDLKGDEHVYAFDEKNKIAQIQPIDKIFCYDYNGKMVHFKGQALDCLVTPNHNMLVGSADEKTSFRIMTADQLLKETLKRRIPSEASFDGNYPEYFEIPESKIYMHSNPKEGFVSDTIRLPIKPFMEFMGWYLSEGWSIVNVGDDSRYNFYRIGISQSEKANQKKYDLIGSCIEAMGFKPFRDKIGWYFNSKPLAIWLNKLGFSHDKYIPIQLKQMHPELLQIMLSSMMLGDGTPQGTYGTYATTSNKLASDVQEIALKCGYRTSCSKEHRIGKIVLNNPDYRAKYDMNLIYISKSRARYLTNRESVEYSGKVYCVAIPDYHIILTRRNGKVIWAGNSFWNQNSFGYFINNQNWMDYYRGPCLFNPFELHTTPLSADNVCHVVFKARAVKSKEWLDTYNARNNG